MQNSYLKVFIDWRERYQKLSDAEFGRLIRAALAYKAGEDVPELTGREELMWDGVKLDIDRDNERYSAVCEARSEAGKRGAEARWNSKCYEEDGKNGKSHLPYSKNGQEKDKEKDQEKEKDKDKNLAGFDEFWMAYPRKTGKGEARKAWAKIRPNAELIQQMLDAVKWQSQSDQWQKEKGQYIPHPATWLNQQRWEDEGIVVPKDPHKEAWLKAVEKLIN